MISKRFLGSNVAITKNDDEAKAILEGLGLIGAHNLINNKDIVVITPNWVNPKKPNPTDGVVVGQESLRTIIKFVKGFNPSRVVIATGSGSNSTLEVMKTVGYDRVINEENIEFIDLNKGPYIDLPLNHTTPSSTKINTLYNEMTFLISFTQLKQHEEATMSGAIKNVALGWPPAEVHGYPKKNLGIHNDLHGFIRAMAEKMIINLSIVSANPTMVGTGPTNGVPKHTGFVICGTDAIAVDTICARLLGFRPQAISYLFQLKDLNLGQTVLENINLSGIDLKVAEEEFSKAIYGNSLHVDK